VLHEQTEEDRNYKTILKEIKATTMGDNTNKDDFFHTALENLKKARTQLEMHKKAHIDGNTQEFDEMAVYHLIQPVKRSIENMECYKREGFANSVGPYTIIDVQVVQVKVASGVDVDVGGTPSSQNLEDESNPLDEEDDKKDEEIEADNYENAKRKKGKKRKQDVESSDPPIRRSHRRTRRKPKNLHLENES